MGFGANKCEDAITHNSQSKKIQYKINRRPTQSKNNTARSKGQIKRREREKASVRANIEHVFGIVKCLFGYRKMRYRADESKLPNLICYSHWRIWFWLTGVV